MSDGAVMSYGPQAGVQAERDGKIRPGDVMLNHDGSMSRWSGFEWMEVHADVVPEIKVGDQIKVHGLVFVCTVLEQHYDGPPVVEFRSPIELIKEGGKES
jgi:hypothetical protein